LFSLSLILLHHSDEVERRCNFSDGRQFKLTAIDNNSTTRSAAVATLTGNGSPGTFTNSGGSNLIGAGMVVVCAVEFFKSHNSIGSGCHYTVNLKGEL
jgi:hypothetical protein